jgi:predicted hotdog family 3-hydroxylacyl-ACP dehydratase
MTATAHSDFEELLPHRPPMLMLTAIRAQDTDSVHCSSVIDAHNPLLRDGLFPATGGLELLAQAAGTLLGVRTPGNAARPGAIVQVKSFRVEQLRIPVGAELHIHSRYMAGSADAAIFEGEVTFNEQCFFTGTLMIAILPEVAT